jgi:hypothetical protein
LGLNVAQTVSALVNAEEETVVEPGNFEIFVGGGLHQLLCATLVVE